MTQNISSEKNNDNEIQNALAMLSSAVRQYLDDFARTRGYDNIIAAVTYSTSSVDQFSKEGRYAIEARDSTWLIANNILDHVENNNRHIPSIKELYELLPVLQWPE